MNDFKLKMVLSILSGIVFAFIFVLLALVVPVHETEETIVIPDKPKNRLEAISQSFQDR